MSGARRQVRVRYEGLVQGVGFRYTVREVAGRLGVTGGAENLPDGSVQVVGEGTEGELQRFLQQVRLSRVGRYILNERVAWGEAEGRRGFYYR